MSRARYTLYFDTEKEATDHIDSFEDSQLISWSIEENNKNIFKVITFCKIKTK